MIRHEIDMPPIWAWLRTVRAVEDLVVLSSRLQLDCQMQAQPAYYLAALSGNSG